MLVTVAMATACVGAGEDAYRDTLNGLPTVDVKHEQDALAIVAGVYGVQVNPEVSWVVGGLRDQGGVSVGGVHIDCQVWIAWWGTWNTSGASSDGPAISYTSFAHELAHCALWMSGDPDASHSNPVWWGPDGLVYRANTALIAAGI